MTIQFSETITSLEALREIIGFQETSSNKDRNL